jgi:hypothetical protein
VLTGASAGGEIMKVFRVVTQKDGETTRKPGEVSTKVFEVNRHYVAMTIGEVWNKLPDDIPAEEEVMAVIEVISSVTILQA